MKKTLLSLGVALLATVGAQANHYTDVDQIGVLLTGGSGNRYLGTFDIVHNEHDTITIGAPYLVPPQTFHDVAGFQPGRNGPETIDTVWAWFYFRDNNDTKTEAVRIGLDNTWFTPGGGSGQVVLNNQTITILGGSGEMAIQALQIDGILKYNVIRTAGDFYFDYARLEVDTHIPDGGATAILLGMGVLAMGAVRRKLA